jgi:hypothetical protein
MLAILAPGGNVVTVNPDAHRPSVIAKAGAELPEDVRAVQPALQTMAGEIDAPLHLVAGRLRAGHVPRLLPATNTLKFRRLRKLNSLTSEIMHSVANGWLRESVGLLTGKLLRSTGQNS